MVRSAISVLGTALNLYAVPLAGAVLGWIFVSRLVIWILEIVAADSSIQQAFMVSSPLMYTVQFVSAIVLFLIVNRYFN